ncbi:MAG: hypothetical protein ACOYWZ_10435 [Bacillota bacterium]
MERIDKSAVSRTSDAFSFMSYLGYNMDDLVSKSIVNVQSDLVYEIGQ